MTTSTPNLGLVLYNSTTDSAEYFSNFRAVIAGTSLSSNFYKIDTAYGSMQTEIDDIQAGAYFTLASYISANYYEATVTGVTAYNTGMKIILRLDVASSGTVTLNINSLGTKSVMKIDSSGTPANISAGELMVGKYYFFAYDGTRWVWVDSTSADQLYIAGTSGNVVTVNSDNTLLGTTTQSSLISSTINSATSKATPVDADEIGLVDSAASNVLKHLTWSNLKATLKTYFDSLSPLPSSENQIINSGFDYAQRLTSPSTLTTIVDNKYSADRWRVTRENSDVQYQRNDALGESGLTSVYYGSFKKITSAGKIYIFQPIEGESSVPYRSKTMTFQVMMKASSSMTIRMGVVELQNTGTLDTIPATFVSSFGSNGTDPTLGSNLALVSPAESKSVTTSWTKFSVTVSIPSNSKNIIPAIWSNNQLSANDVLSIAEAGFYISSTTQTWGEQLASVEYSNILRYCERMIMSTTNSTYPPLGVSFSTTGAIVQIPCYPKRNSSGNTLTISDVSHFTFLAQTLSTFTGSARLPNFMVGVLATASTWTSGAAGFLVTSSGSGGNAYLLIENEL